MGPARSYTHPGAKVSVTGGETDGITKLGSISAEQLLKSTVIRAEAMVQLLRAYTHHAGGNIYVLVSVSQPS